MKTTVTHSSDTKQKVLEAACKVFSEVGYHEGTVARICEEAGANRAAVNYYFGDKQNLYREVWNHAFQLAQEAHPLWTDRAGLSPEEKLRAFMRSLILRAFDPGRSGCFARILAYEMADPQEFLEADRAEVRDEHQSRLEAIVQELLGAGARQEDLTLCRIMVMAPSLGIGIGRLGPQAKHIPHAMFEFEPEQMAEKMFRFALAGMKDVRRRIEGRSAKGEGAER